MPEGEAVGCMAAGCAGGGACRCEGGAAASRVSDQRCQPRALSSPTPSGVNDDEICLPTGQTGGHHWLARPVVMMTSYYIVFFSPLKYLLISWLPPVALYCQSPGT